MDEYYGGFGEEGRSLASLEREDAVARRAQALLREAEEEGAELSWEEALVEAAEQLDYERYRPEGVYL
jgi:hypothetical protein